MKVRANEESEVAKVSISGGKLGKRLEMRVSTGGKVCIKEGKQGKRILPG